MNTSLKLESIPEQYQTFINCCAKLLYLRRAIPQKQMNIIKYNVNC